MRLAIVLASCSAIAARAQDTTRIQAGAPLWGNQVGIRQLYVLGGPPDYDIGRVYSTAVDKSNRVYVFDAQRFQMREYDANGHFVRDIGRAGAGPGEYRQVLGATIVEDSVLLAYDVGTLRLSRFSPDGTFLGATQLRRPLTLTSGTLRSDMDDRLLFHATFVIAPDGRSSQQLPPGRKQVIRVAPDGRFLDSMPMPQFPPPAQPYFNQFAPRWYMADLPGVGIVVGYSDSYRFTIVPFDGKPRVVEKAWTPIPLAGEERDQVVANYEQTSRRSPTHPAVDVPRTKPAYREIFTDQDGRIWVSLFTASARRSIPRDTSRNAPPPIEWRQDLTFDVFDSGGRFLGTVVLPYGSTIWSARNDRVYAKSVGPEGEDRLIAYQITGIRK